MPEELIEAVGLYTRWTKRDVLKLTASERFWLKHRLTELGIELANDPKRAA